MLVNADSRRIPLRDGSVHCVVTSPPYWGLRDYQVDGQIGLEQTPEAYVENMVAVMREVWRVLRDDGTLWLNLGDSYAGSGGSGGEYNEGGLREGQPRVRGIPVKSKRQERGAGRWGGGNNPATGCIKPKDLVGIPWMVAFALRADGWYLRSDCIWSKPNPMPEPVADRPSRAHEYMFLLSRQPRYYYDRDAILEPVAESTIGRGPVDFGGSKGHTYKENIAPDDPNYRAGSAQWGRTFDYRESCKNRRNRRTVWTVATEPYAGAHYAVFPTALITPCILAGCPKGGIVLDPFCGSGTVGEVCRDAMRQFVGLDISLDYLTEQALPRAERKTAPDAMAKLPMFAIPEAAS